ncbi:hypothetical protein [Brunnivagina elsteri]|uniref:DUF2281 domain-containing protein n=1 Tax=Brunnivagina elsteri CCALA 953 TaxID=987040 RepID=A0A2A2TLF8_9CYAN|nr:hypothetical protein [Calothrix elsteri]PAX58315.1 hypothetical protein CK510_08215 [Calothrix elsteri CCALA 953]
MVNKELLIQEIESLPSELLNEAFDFIRFIKISHAKRQITDDYNSSLKTNAQQQAEKTLYPLHNTQPYRYENPTEPVALEDWEFLQ